jgi:hypothetical protein
VAIDRRDAIQPAFDAILGIVDQVLSVDLAATERAKSIVLGSTRLSARDALHLAVMEQHSIGRILSFDSGFDGHPGIALISTECARLGRRPEYQGREVDCSSWNGFASPSAVEPQHVEYRPIALQGQTPNWVNCAKRVKWFASRIRISRMRSRAISWSTLSCAIRL